MSFPYLQRALEANLPYHLKLVFLILAHYANDCGSCWPAVATIAKKCGLSARSIQRALAELERRGLIVRQSRFSGSGSQTSNAILLFPGMDPSLIDDVPPPLSNSPEGGVAVTQTTTEQSGDVVKNHNNSALVYPKQLSPTERESASRLIQQFEHDTAQLLLDELGARLRRGEIKKSCIGYLRILCQRANTGEFVPEVASQEQLLRSKPKQQMPEPRLVTDRVVARGKLAQIKGLLK